MRDDTRLAIFLQIDPTRANLSEQSSPRVTQVKLRSDARCGDRPHSKLAQTVNRAGAAAVSWNSLLDGSRHKWFRPSDVCVAPDGSLLVADWYDPGVGGHRMEDVVRGRIFRVTTKGKL